MSMKYYKLSFENIKKYNFLGGVFLLDRIKSDDIEFHFVRIETGKDGYLVLAASTEAIEFAKTNKLPEELLKQERNIKVNEVAFDTLNLSRSILRSPGDEGVLTNNSDLIIEMVLFMKEFFTTFGLPVAYWKRFLKNSNKETIKKIRNMISTEVMTLK